MEDQFKNSPEDKTRSHVRIPPPRGQIKAKIFKEICKKVKSLVSMMRKKKKVGEK